MQEINKLEQSTFGNIKDSSVSQIKLSVNDDIKKAIEDAYIIVIVGAMGSGKTTASANIADMLGREVLVISPYHHKVDEELFQSYNMDILTKGEYLKPRVEKLRDATIIFDDIEKLSERNMKYLKSILIDLRKRNLKLILVYHHGYKIPRGIIENNVSFLIVKSGSHFTHQKLAKYFDVYRIAKSAIGFCDAVSDYEFLYLFKTGYFSKDGNEISQIPAKTSAGTLKYDFDEVVKLANQGLKISEIAKKIGASKKTIDKYVKIAIDEGLIVSEKMGGSFFPIRDFSLTGYRDERKLIIEWNYDNIRVGKATGEKAENIEGVSKKEKIGNLATHIIGMSLLEILQDKIDAGYTSSLHMRVDEGREKEDIIISNPSKSVSIEVKNWKSNPKRGRMNISDIRDNVIPRFSEDADNKWLFCCGVGCGRNAKKMLKDNNIKYLRLTNNQINNINSGQKCRIKSRLRNWLNDVL